MGELKNCYRVALGELDTAGGVVGVANPEEAKIIVTKVIIEVTTVSDAACTLDAGIAAGITTLDDTLIDGVDVNGATGIFDNIDDQGTNGKCSQSWDADEFFTISKASGAAAGLEGYVYIQYLRA